MARPHLPPPRRAYLAGLAPLFPIQQAGAQDGERLQAVLELGTLILAGDDHSGGPVGDPHR